MLEAFINTSAIVVPLPTHRASPIADTRSVEICISAGMRQVVVDGATAMPSTDTPEKQRTFLRRNILHRFKSAVTRTRDAEVDDEEPPADVSEEGMVAARKRLMQLQGAKSCKLAVLHVFCFLLQLQLDIYYIATSQKKQMLPAGCADTGTLMVLSEIPETEAFLFFFTSHQICASAAKLSKTQFRSI
jgi:hypothetical protein